MAVASLASVFMVFIVAGASATTPVTIGQNLGPFDQDGCTESNAWVPGTVSPGTSYEVPTGMWNITSWTTTAYNNSAALIVWRPTGTPNTYEVVGASQFRTLATQAGVSQTFTLDTASDPAIAVQGGDLLGVSFGPEGEVSDCLTPDDSNGAAAWLYTAGTQPLVGSQVEVSPFEPLRLNISAELTPADDGTTPTASPTQLPAANGADWNNSDVTVTWNWADEAGGSGIDPAHCTTSSPSKGEGNPITLNATCKDFAGNTGSASYPVKVDETAPTINCAISAPGPRFELGSLSQQVGATLTDALSGPASQSLLAAADTSTVGGKTVNFNGSDNAGNPATTRACPYGVGYRFGGFTSPLPKTTVKAGSTLPLKFALQSASGQPISDAEAQSLVSQACKITVTVVTGGLVSGCPTYSTTSKRFHFNLKTTNAMKGANGVSITVTVGSTIVTASAVDPFTVK